MASEAPCPPFNGAIAAHERRITDLRATAAVLCTEGQQNYPGSGEWETMSKKVTSTGVDAIVAAFERADAAHTNSPCAADLIVGPTVVLVEANGQYVIPQYPRDECGQPQSAAIKAVDSAPWQYVSTTKMSQVRSQLSVATGCPMGWKNTLAFEPASPLLSTPAEALGSGSVGTIAVCEYQNPPADPLDGSLLAGERLSGTQSAELRTALGAAGHPGNCAVQDRFLVVQTTSGAGWVTVELGGCWRVQRNDLGNEGTRIGQAQPGLLQPILSDLHAR